MLDGCSLLDTVYSHTRLAFQRECCGDCFLASVLTTLLFTSSLLQWKTRTASFDSQGSCPSPKAPASPWMEPHVTQKAWLPFLLSVCVPEEKKKATKTKPEHKNPCHLRVSSDSPGLLSTNSCSICLKSLEPEPCFAVTSWRPCAQTFDETRHLFGTAEEFFSHLQTGGGNLTTALSEESLQEVSL